MEEPGQVAYSGYFNWSGGKSLISGHPLPDWKEQSAEIKAAWAAAERAVKLRYGAIY